MRKRYAVLLLTLLCVACTRDAPDDGAAPLTDADTPADLTRQVSALMPRLQRLSGLDRRDVLRVRRQDRAAMRDYVVGRLDQEMPRDEREALRRTYVALGLIPDTLDLDALLLDLYTEQVLGYYDPKSKTLYVIESADEHSLRPVLAHELVHALQDQHTNLDSLIARERGNDRQVAAHAAMEGHAMVVMFAVLAEQASRRNIDPATLPDPATELGPALEAQNAQYPVFQRAPRIIKESMLFPYLSGAGFVHQLWSSLAPRPRYPAPMDSLLPQSTEQVMHPVERFIRTRDEPSEVRMAGVPNGWRVVHEDELGQLETAIFLEEHLGAAARRAAEGWDGDRYMLLRDDAGREVLHWYSTWDTRAQADAFAAAAERAGREFAAAATVVERRTIFDTVELVRITITPAGSQLGAVPVPSVAVNRR